MITRCLSCFQEYESEYGMCPYCGYSIEDRAHDTYCLFTGAEIAGRYIIGGVCGMGGFGIVYRAWDKKLESVVAIKEYFPSGMVNRLPGDKSVVLVAVKQQREFQQGKERFLDEARNLARFNTHPNIVNVFNYFEENNTAYFVMEYLDGENLFKTIKDQGRPLPPDVCLNIAFGICEALRAIHAANILHRDVSPQNIFICHNGNIKLIDFGSARLAETQDTRLPIVVKPGFAPPEQYERVNKQGAWTDVYALGATLYYALTGQNPIESTDRKEQNDMLAPAAVNPNIPEDLSTAVMRAMAVYIPYRYHDVDEFEQTLLKQRKAVPVEKVKKRRKFRQLASISAALLIVAVMLTAAGFIWKERQIPEADLTIWYMTTGDPATDAEKEAALHTIAKQFMDEYTSITIFLQGVELDHYQETLEQADKRPELYESTNLNVGFLEDAVDLEQLLNQLEASGSSTEAALTEKRQYPIGLTIPIIYVNISLGAVEDLSTLEAIIAACTAADSSMVAAQESSKLYTYLYDGSDISGYCHSSARDEFLAGEALVYLGSSMDYRTIQEQLPGLYMIFYPDTDSSVYDYASLWSVSETERQTERSALMFLEYLTSDVSQDYLHIQHQSGAIPVTHKMQEEYLTVYQELSGLAEFLEKPFSGY